MKNGYKCKDYIDSVIKLLVFLKIASLKMSANADLKAN